MVRIFAIVAPLLCLALGLMFPWMKTPAIAVNIR